ncbi:MAG TPA: polyprenyl synthetase family protein [Chitinophagaceae bacterium]|nr:polyprenyl synthetase family protein [Chitinophagaceae bacterium]
MEKVTEFLHLNLITFDKKFNALLEGNNKILKYVLKYIIRSKGKKMRPMFVFLSAQIAGGINESTYRTASMIELLHTATLVHDDVVDDALQRRSFFSINAIWKNKIAVLVGDYLLAKGLLLSIDNEDFELLKITSNAVKEMSEGELLQIEKARKLDITEAIYFEIIRSKTASLLASACAAGAFSARQDKETADRFRKFGEMVGIAFQIKDDLLDYGHQQTGKPSGGDIKEKKMTLPLIYTLQKAPDNIKKQIIYIVKNENTNKSKVDLVMSRVKEYGGLDYAEHMMGKYKNEALELLLTFPASEARNAMEELVNFTISRSK